MAPQVTRDAPLSRPQLCLLSHAQMDIPLLHSHNPQLEANAQEMNPLTYHDSQESQSVMC